MGPSPSVDSLLELLAAVPDPRVARTRDYPLAEVLWLVFAAILSGFNDVVGMAKFGEVKLSWLQRWLPYANGTPSHDTIGRVLGLLQADVLESMFAQWMSETVAHTKGIVAIDGKTVRGAVRRGAKASMVHMVSAFGVANGLVYGQVKSKEKSNEITAIPALLDALHLEGCIVTIDAIGCQIEILEKIVAAGADFVIGVKGNQKTLLDDIDIAFHDVDLSGGNAGGDLSEYETEDVGHGRGEWRRCEVLDAARHLSHPGKWRWIRTLIRVTSERRGARGTEPTQEVRYYASSLSQLDARRASNLVRSHWRIENQLHWVLDVQFGEDGCRVQALNAAENLSVLRHVALNVLRANAANMKTGIVNQRRLLGLSDDLRDQVLRGAFN